jgi:hypothetical protein
VLAGFDRMFHHQPTHTHPQVPSEVDVLVMALVDLLGDVHAQPVRLAYAGPTR